MINTSKVKANGKKLVPVKWVFKSKEETDVLIRLKSKNVVKGYMKVPVFDYTESLSPVATDTPTSIIIVLNLYHK